MANRASVNLSNDEVEIVQSADDQEHQEETTENFQMEMEPSTQYVLEVEPAEEPKKKGKGKGKSTSLSITKKKIMNHGFVKWLKSIWIADTTLRIMKPWLKAINKESVRMKNQKMFLIGKIMSQVMKQFFIHMKDAKKSLTECSYANFEEWCLDEGLSMMSGKLLEMDWEEDLTEKLFDLYSDFIMELRRLQNDLESDNDQEVLPEKQKTQYKESSSLPNMKNISTLSMTAHTREVPVDAYTFNDSVTTPQPTNSRKRTHDGATLKNDTLMKGKSLLKSKKTVQFESVSDDKVYRPGQLFKNKKAVEEMSDPELLALNKVLNFIEIDFEAVRYCPKVSAKAIFYKRRLATYNATVYDVESRRASKCGMKVLRPEDQTSCLLVFLI